MRTKSDTQNLYYLRKGKYVMQKNFMRFVKLMTLAIVTIALAACGRSHDNTYYGVTIPGMGTASISGYVSGGTIVVVDAASNTEVRRIASTRYAAGQKSFSMPLAIGKSYKFYLIDNAGTADERVYPLYQGSANKFSVSTTNFLDFGFISTVTGVAIPANDITQIRGVVADGEDKAFPGNLAASAFTGADLQGTWQMLQLVCGKSSRWVRSTIALAADGTSTGADYVSSLDSGTTPAAAYAITPGGIVTVQNGLTNIFSGVMARDKRMIIGTASPEVGNYGMVIMIRSGAAYAAADLQGDWKYNQLVAGANPAWAHGDASIDATGAISVTKAASSATTAPDTLSGNVSIDPVGIVTASSRPSFYGVMSSDKNLLFAVATNADNSPCLTIFTRFNSLAYSAEDLHGMWRANWLSATNSAFSTSYWGRAFFNVDNGNSYLQSITQSYGASFDAAISANITKDDITKDVVVSFANTDFSGIISLGKNFVVGTMTNGSGNFSLYTFIK
jgi:hypothetical protein